MLAVTGEAIKFLNFFGKIYSATDIIYIKKEIIYYCFRFEN